MALWVAPAAAVDAAAAAEPTRAESRRFYIAAAEDGTGARSSSTPYGS
eukprot:COSAG05_NODE_296_length_11959_cov_17.897639_10_plen_48_part_00